MSELKTGDKVWVLATALEIGAGNETGVRLTVGDYGREAWVKASDYRPVEPPSIKDSLTTESNCSELPNSSSDPINPSHYKHLPTEAIDVIMAAIAGAPSNKAAYLHGQLLKYPLRCWEKNGIEDLKKARWYLDRLIKEVGE